MKKLWLLFAALLFTVTSAAGCARHSEAPKPVASYETLLFDTSRVHTIEVTLSEEDRTEQLASPTEKTKYKADVVIDGEEFKEVSFHTKGNSSLFFTADAGRDKFSYGLNFGKYDKGSTYHGLKKLNLQNHFADASETKEYMAYWLFRRMGVDAPLASYVWLTVNGEVQGLYTAVEATDDSYLKRIADGKGTLYKPEDDKMALNDEEMERLKEGNSAAHDNKGGASLAYIDDREESYPDIFKNAETKEDEASRERVIRALKALKEQSNLDQYLDTEEIIRYFAVHNFMVCYDSYTGPMLHNYTLHEQDGKLRMLPWDYDGSFGCFPPDASVNVFIDSRDVINTGIDSPLGSASEADRPMWSWIMAGEDSRNAYHDVLSELTELMDSGAYEAEAARIHAMITPYAEKDPKTFFSKEQFDKAYATVLKIAELRAESVRRQIDGKLATRSEKQEEADRINTDGVLISDMGTLDDLYAR